MSGKDLGLVHGGCKEGPGAKAHDIEASIQGPEGPCSLRIRCGNDRNKSKGKSKNKNKSKSKSKNKSRFPSGMTERKARAKARATARTKADSLRE